jgi:hypothetical protein
MFSDVSESVALRRALALVVIAVATVIRFPACFFALATMNADWLPRARLFVALAFVASMLVIVIPAELLLVRRGWGWLAGLANLVAVVGGTAYGVHYWRSENRRISALTGEEHLMESDTQVVLDSYATVEGVGVYGLLAPVALALVVGAWAIAHWRDGQRTAAPHTGGWVDSVRR